MKILWGNVTLCDGAVRGAGDPSGPIAGTLTVNGQRVVQVSDMVRAAAAKTRGRANARTTVSFAVSRQYSSAGEAEFHVLKHAAELSTDDEDLVFTAETHGKVTLYSAALETVNATYSGCRATYAYTFKGGLMGVKE